jgi:hypothetical protein
MFDCLVISGYHVTGKDILFYNLCSSAKAQTAFYNRKDEEYARQERHQAAGTKQKSTT